MDYSASLKASKAQGGLSVALPIAIAAILILLPLKLPPYYRSLLTEIFIWGLFSMAFNILYGYTGMLSFGQSLYFGAGAYAVAFSTLFLDLNLPTTLLAAIISSALLAWATGYFAVRVGGHYFVIITVIFSQVFYFITVTFRTITGGDDGLSFKAHALGIGAYKLSFINPFVGYYFVLFVAGIAFFGCMKLLNSPLGMAFVAIKENEARAALLGYNTRFYKLLSFVIAGMLSGLAGALYALIFRFANAGLLYWTISGDAVIRTLVGGSGTMVGPWFGTALLVYATDALSTWMKNYHIAVGFLLVLVVLFAPVGIVGLVKQKTGIGRKTL